MKRVRHRSPIPIKVSLLSFPLVIGDFVIYISFFRLEFVSAILPPFIHLCKIIIIKFNPWRRLRTAAATATTTAADTTTTASYNETAGWRSNRSGNTGMALAIA